MPRGGRSGIVGMTEEDKRLDGGARYEGCGSGIGPRRFFDIPSGLRPVGRRSGGPSGGHGVRRAEPEDAEQIALLLHDFNTEFDEPTPDPPVLARRVRQLLTSGEITVLLAAPRADGLAVLRFRPSLWKEAPESYLEELYVVPARRGQGIGRRLMEAAIELARSRGAVDMHLGTAEDDVAARALYESLGFNNRGGRPDGPVNYFYEREL